MEARLLDVGDPRVDALLDELVTEAVAPTGVVRRQQTRRNGGFEREHQLFAVEAPGAVEDIEVDVTTADSREGEQDLGVVGEETDRRCNTSRMPLGTSTEVTSAADNGCCRCSLARSRSSSLR